MKYEKTQPGNPHKLTVKQHVIPVRSINRFAGEDGKVDVKLSPDRTTKRLDARAGIFWTRRAWDQRTERVLMKDIEDKFQPLADLIVADHLKEIPEESAFDVNQFFSLWFHRSRVQAAEEIETQMNGVTGQTLTKDQQELLEAEHVMFVREGGKVATRHLVGLQLMGRLMADARHHKERRWGIIRASEGEFLMPDVPAHDLLPISPTVLLAANHPSGLITRENLVEVNTEFLAYTRRYFFGRDLSVALDGITGAAIERAIQERDRKISAGVVV